MLSELKTVKMTNDDLVPELIRDIEIVPANAGEDLPAIVITGAYLKREALSKLLKPYENKQKTTDADEKSFRASVVQAAFRGWSGVTLRNLVRVSEYVMLNFDALTEKLKEKGADENTEIAFDIKDAKWMAGVLNGEIFREKIVEELANMAAYAEDKIALEKKD